ncbi:putative C2H2 finger domain protein [Aspergillus saccharolyticus JOP 1030-1]|uniref:Putative C2H2 finger domain protein n=1 Tax=Aspergillus saccharolyticus JOP 1030-1 TaxID=1450539 RepID=A0A318ZL49_9EURO|nr:putative C2H2 finger domain protein [Aspergillus saccharolyticus JOP 1030-1]PYH40958.1 putative C2H2 finger domain protein [Aspergillus saccharolyticus JOP 1030-1]
MASFKELSLSRPLPQSNPRNHSHSHSISLGAANANHRVTRRKSVTTAAAANVAAAAVAASLKESGDAMGIPMPAHRRGSRKGWESSSVGAPSGFGSYLSRSMNSPSQEPPVARKTSPSQTTTITPPATITENSGPVPSDSSNSAAKPVNTKNRNRRASEGGHLVKPEGKRSMAELRCERCGKGYKHGSCLSKHMWEHDPAWAITSKLLISKHQQVQLLEAASVLVTMTQEDPDENAEADSEISSSSPDASSELQEGLSSAETTPPPMDEDDDDDEDMSMEPTADKRFSVGNASGLFSHSYQSGPSSSFTSSAPWASPAFSHVRHSSIDTRPSTAEAKLHEDDEADLAAAIGLCNFGTPRMGPVPLSPSVPPVPSLPTRFLDQRSPSDSQSHSLDQSNTGLANSAFSNPTSNIFLSLSYNPSLSYKVSDEREVRVDGATDRAKRQTRNADVDFSSRPAQADDDDDGIFGRMEE